MLGNQTANHHLKLYQKQKTLIHNNQNMNINPIYSTNTPHLNVFFKLKKGSLHDVPQHESVRLKVEGVSSKHRDALPVPSFQRLVSHQLQERARLVKVVDLLLQRVERWPVLQSSGQLPAS